MSTVTRFALEIKVDVEGIIDEVESEVAVITVDSKAVLVTLLFIIKDDVFVDEDVVNSEIGLVIDVVPKEVIVTPTEV